MESKKLRIAIFEPTRMLPGGGQKVMPAIAANLSKKNEVTIFTQKPTQGGLTYGKAKIKLIKPSNAYLAFLAFLLQKVTKEEFDIVIYGCYPANFAAIRNSKLPSIQIIHSPPRAFYDLKKFILRNSSLLGKIKVHTANILFKKMDYLGERRITKILGICKETKKQIKEYYKRESEILYPGIYPDNYQSGRYENYILAPGRIVLNKRPKTIVKAMEFVKNKSIKLVVVGSGNMSREIKNMSQNYKNIDFRGFVSEEELKRLYSNCLAVIYIPVNEHYGYVPVEAAASGKATIGVNEGGLKETIIEGKTGFLIDNINPKKLAEKIDFFANNRKLAIKMGKAAKKYGKKFYWQESFKVLDRAIEELARR